MVNGLKGLFMMIMTCNMCSGEYCVIHHDTMCGCDVIDRHGDELCPFIDDIVRLQPFQFPFFSDNGYSDDL